MQGFNMGRYVPPDLEGTISGNKLSNKHPLGSRARKSSQGILTVRFEMPYAIWCTTCPRPTIIPQGVRFNAEKKRVGNYYSTPIYAFRMKHTACGGWIEIRTDPQNTAYVVTEGAKKRDYAEDKVREGDEGMVILTEEEREKRRNDAFANLEGKVQDKRQAQTDASRIEELFRARERDWEDTDSANKRLRSAFRKERKIRVRKEKENEDLKEKLGTGMDILEEVEEDRLRAGMVDFGGTDGEREVRRAGLRPLFAKILPNGAPPLKPGGKKDKTRGTEQKMRHWQQEVQGNTMATLDPFTIDNSRLHASSTTQIITGIKRKQTERNAAKEGTAVTNAAGIDDRPQSAGPRPTTGGALVDYESD